MTGWDSLLLDRHRLCNFSSRGAASNYLFGAVNSAIYLLLSFQASFYGEVLTTVYFFIMQPIGLYTLSNRVNEQDKEEPSHFEAKKLDWRGWLKYLALTALIWIGMGFAYKSIHSHRPFRDSVTDATNGIGQLLMTGLYREQWIFWIATNLSVSIFGGVVTFISRPCTGSIPLIVSSMVSVDQGGEESLNQGLRFFDRKNSLGKEETHDQTGYPSGNVGKRVL